VLAAERRFGEAEELLRAGHFREAALAFEEVGRNAYGTLGREPARALVRAAALWADQLGDPARAAADCWRAISKYPDAAPADDAVLELVRLHPPRLREQLLRAVRAAGQHEVADNLAFEAAALAEKDAPAQARAEYEVLAASFPHSALRDDALWRAARLARAAGDADGALDDLARITARRREPLFVGSYNSQWLDDAQLEAGRIWLEDKHDVDRAVAAFEFLRDDMTQSTLRDDAQMWIARARAQAGDRRRACEALARLRRDFAESRYLRREAPALAGELGCALK